MIWLLRLYPRAWRALYEEEFRALLEQQPPSLPAMLDIAAGALDAHLHLEERIGSRPSQIAVLRRVALTVLCAYVACAVAAWQFGTLLDDGPYAFNMAAGHPGPLLDLDLGNPLSAAADAVALGAAGAALALLVGGLPLVTAVWTRSPHLRRLLLGLPVAGLAVLVPPAVNLLAYAFSGGVVSTTALFSPGTLPGAAYILWIVVAAGAGTRAIVRAIGRSELPAPRVRFTFLPSVAATAAMLLMLGGTIAWGLAAHLQEPGLFDRPSIRMGYATVCSWAPIVAVMGLSSALAVRAIMRGEAAYSRATVARPGSGRRGSHAPSG